MTVQEITAHDLVSFDDLKLLASAKGPCVTILSAIPNPLENPIRIPHMVRRLRNTLAERGVGSAAADAVVAPVNDLAITAETGRIWGNTLIVFTSPELFQYYFLPCRLPETLIAAGRFQFRPLLSVLAREQRFRLLCLSRQQVRLFHCAYHRVEEVDLKRAAPVNFPEWLNNRIPDHVLDGRSAAGPSNGSMKGVMFGTSSDRDRESESVKHFFKEVDRGVNRLLANDSAPLVLAAVEEELALYRPLNRYPRLLDRAVTGSPDGLPPRTLHERALEIVSQTRSEPLQKALAEYSRRRDAGRVTFDPGEATKAAFQGRVADLFLLDDPQAPASASGEEDPLNAAIWQTVLNGGRAFALPASEMPEQAGVIAALRY